MIIVCQPLGLGDVIFIMTAIRRLNQPVLWPVMHEFVDGLNEAYPDIHFFNWKEIDLNWRSKSEFGYKGLKVIPLFAQDLPLVECMRNKYRYFGLDWNIWKEQAMFKRNAEKENELFELLGLKEGEEFNVVQKTFHSTFSKHRDIKPPDNGFKTIYVEKIDGYSLFNWAKVFENATTIHAVNSSNVYIFDLLDLKAPEIKLYKKLPLQNNHDSYSDLLTIGKYIFE